MGLFLGVLSLYFNHFITSSLIDHLGYFLSESFGQIWRQGTLQIF